MGLRLLLAALLLAACAGANAFIGKGYCSEMTCTSGVNNVPQARWKGNQGKAKYLGAFDTLKECESACLKYKNWKGKTCKSFAWHDPEQGTGCKGKKKCFDGLCYGLTSDAWDPVPQANVISGKIGQGVAEAVNKAFSTVTSTVSSVEVPSISITGVFGGEDVKKKPDSKDAKKEERRRAEESKRKEKEAKEREFKERKAAEEARREREKKQAEDAKRAEEQRREDSRRREQQSKKSQEEAKRREEARAAEEARKKKASEEQKRAEAARAKAQEQEAKKNKKKGKSNGSSSGGFLGVEGLDLLLSASATRMSISAAIVAILATYFGAKHAERSVKHKKLEEDLRSKGHIDDEGAWRL